MIELAIRARGQGALSRTVLLFPLQEAEEAREWTHFFQEPREETDYNSTLAWSRSTLTQI